MEQRREPTTQRVRREFEKRNSLHLVRGTGACMGAQAERVYLWSKSVNRRPRAPRESAQDRRRSGGCPTGYG